MQEITKQKYFYFLAFFLIASTFLPLVFNNLPPLIRSHHLWTFIWAISLLIFSPKIFVNKLMVYVLVYGVLLFLATETIWSTIDDWNRERLFFEFYEIAIGVSVITYFLQSKDYLRLAKIAKWSLIFLFITAIMSIISSAIDPMYARNLTALIEAAGEKGSKFSIKNLGGGTYSTAGSFMCLFPILIYYYKNIRESLISKKQIVIYSIIVFFALLGMQIFGNILISIIFGIIALFGMKNIRLSILVIVLFFSIMVIIPQKAYVNTLLSVSNYFEKDSDLKFKLGDLAFFIETGSDINDNSSSAGMKAGRYPKLMRTFVQSPLMGCYFFSDESGNGYDSAGAHLYWMNKLTITGFVGLILFLIIPYSFIKNSLKNFNSAYKFFYLIASLSILSYGLIKVIGGRDTWYAFFVILPGLYYLPLLKRANKKPNTSNNDMLISKQNQEVNKIS